MTMKYYVEYQFRPAGRSRPLDDGEVAGIEFESSGGSALLPNVGDYVSVDNSMDGGKRVSISGRVVSRFFRYLRTHTDDLVCAVNIVLDEVDDNDPVWGELVKE